MSLNGLDSPAVQEAYQVAIAEPGGWLLLKYNSRDSVELLGRGKGGAHEARTAIAKYDEKSPLYGLTIYRRRKVLLKYVPEGTSRVLLARTAVHFEDVKDKFTPYETILEITTPEGLSDTSLAASFPLHTASTSAASSRLQEISEDAEDGAQSARPASPRSTDSISSRLHSQRHRTERRLDQVLHERPSSPPSARVESTSQPETPPASAPSSRPTSPPKKTHISQFLVRDDSVQASVTTLDSTPSLPTSQYTTQDGASENAESKAKMAEASETPLPTSPTKEVPAPAPLRVRALSEESSKSPEKPRVVPEVRLPNGLPERPTTQQSTKSVAPSAKDYENYYDFSKFEPKPKPKLGPRPITSGERTKRPTVASVASLPATYRPTSSQKPEKSRPKAHSQSPIVPPVLSPTTKEFPAPPPIPSLPEYNPRPVSRGSIKSLPSHKSTAMTPDKIRLMKAVELRKKQLRKSAAPADTFVAPRDEDAPALPKVADTISNPEEDKPAGQAVQEDEAREEAQENGSKKADSGISMDYDETHDQAGKKSMEEQESHQSPVSPVQAPEDTPTQADAELEKADTHRIEQDQTLLDSRTATPRDLGYSGDDNTHDTSMKEQETAGETREVAETRDGLGVTVPEQEGAANIPSIVMSDGSRPISSTEHEAKAEHHSIAESPVADSSDEEEETSEGDLEVPDKNIRRQNSDIAKRRRGFVEPLHLEPDGEYSTDDELMEELKTATVEEAQPITVSKSPLATYFPRRPSGQSVDLAVRPITINRSSTMQSDSAQSAGSQERLTHSPSSSVSSARKVSSSSLEKQDPTAATRRNVSTGISQRIQALSESSSSPGRPSSPEQKRHGQRDFMRSPPPIASRTSSFRAISRNSTRLSSFQSQASANSHQSAESNTVWNVQHDKSTNRDSVSVSARIVRPNVGEKTESNLPDGDVELQPPQLLINHQRGSPSPQVLPPINTNTDNEPSQSETAPTKGTSPTLARRSIDAGHRVMHSASKFGRHKAPLSPTGPSAEDFPVPPSPQRNPPPASEEQSGAPKESTRAGRFFKRMSNIGSKRRSGAPQSIASSSSPVSERGSVAAGVAAGLPSGKDKQDMPPPVVVGDLNIQFPDSLLWKRRIVEIDDAGNLLFSISQAMEHQKVSAKKFPLAEFKLPYIPDLDRQELPNSILLDFVDGTTLQLACEDTMTHKQVVHVLKAYWKAWSGA